MAVEVRQLTRDDTALMEALMTAFGEAFDDMDAYTGSRPSSEYTQRLLGSDSFIALAALKGDQVVDS